MKKQIFIIFFVTVHLFFIGFQIDKQSRLVKLSYAKQIHEKTIKQLTAKKQSLQNHLYALQNHQKIKLFAKQNLGMEPLRLKNLKSLPRNETVSYEPNK